MQDFFRMIQTPINVLIDMTYGVINIRPPGPPGVWHAKMWTDLSFYCRFQFASMRTPINVLMDMANGLIDMRRKLC